MAQQCLIPLPLGFCNVIHRTKLWGRARFTLPPMDNFYRYGLSRQDLNVRAAHSLCRAGWMLTEVNGVLQNGTISSERFARIRQQATTFDQLQRQFGPPPQFSATDETQTVPPTVQANLRKTLTIRVMNRGVEEAAAVLTHHGWHYSQIQNVLKPSASPVGNLNIPHNACPVYSPTRRFTEPRLAPFARRRPRLMPC